MLSNTKVIAKFFISCCLVLVFLSTVIGGDNPPTKNSFVASSVSLKQKKIKAGTEGELLITLTPKKGIHINLDPPLSVKLDSSDAVSSIGKPFIPKKDTIFDTSKPIRFPFTVSKNVKPGNITIQGILTYFYCSETDGWCSKFKQPLVVKLTVVK